MQKQAAVPVVLISSPNERTRSKLFAILAETGWTVHQTSNYLEAIVLLERRHFPVVIADGRWREIVDAAALLPRQPRVIVTVTFADESLWAEVLNLGGFDVLAQPFEATEVARIAYAALRRRPAVFSTAPAAV